MTVDEQLDKVADDLEHIQIWALSYRPVYEIGSKITPSWAGAWKAKEPGSVSYTTQ